MNQGQQKLLAGLQNTGPTRWMLRSVAITQHGYMLREVMVAYMMEHLAFRLHHDGVDKVKGLVVCPAANMHHWWAAGWQGSAMSSIQFMKANRPEGETYDCVLIDAQLDYPDKYVEKLDAFFADSNVPHAVIWLPRFEEGMEPEWMTRLMEVLKKHRFVSLKID